MKRVVTCSALACVLCVPLAAAFLTTPPQFSPLTLAVGGNPRGVTVGDFNADGHLDFAVANHSSPNQLSIYFSDGRAGGLRIAAQFSLPVGPFGITNADLNHDGRRDIIVTSADSNSLEIITWDADTASFSVRGPYAAETDPREVVAGDFDRDGHVDLAMALFGCHCVGVWRGFGNFAFSGIRIPTATRPHGLATADFNRDGILDLVVTHESAARATVLFGDGTTNFPSSTSIATGGGPRNVTVGDLNEDGWTDFATVNTSGRSITLGLGVRTAPGSFTSTVVPRTVNIPSTLRSPRDIEAVDANGDGKLDLAVVDFVTANLWVFLGDGQGNFGPFEGVNSSTDGFFAGEGARTIATGDINEDGRVDLLVGNQSDGTVTLFRNQTPFRGRFCCGPP